MPTQILQLLTLPVGLINQREHIFKGILIFTMYIFIFVLSFLKPQLSSCTQLKHLFCRGFLSPFSSKHIHHCWGFILVNDINDSLSSWKAIPSCQLKGVLKESGSFNPGGSKCVSLFDSDPLDEFGSSSNSSSVGPGGLQMRHRAVE